jgi:chromate transport protein ChrA
MMIVAIGQWVAGLPGAVVVLIAFFLPPALLAFFIGRLWNRLEKWPWRTSIQRGLAPVSIGLLLAGSLTMARELSPVGSRQQSPSLCLQYCCEAESIPPSLCWQEPSWACWRYGRNCWRTT